MAELETITWERAEVDASRTVRVPLSRRIGPEFQEEFSRIVQRRAQEARGEPWGPIALVDSGGTIMVSSVPPTALDDLRYALNKIVETASIAAIRARKQRAEDDRLRREKSAEDKRLAAEMQERLRAGDRD